MVESLKTLANEVLGFVEEKIGGKVYFEKRAEVERHVANVRDERRKKQKVQAVVNPAAHAQRKIKENLAKRRVQKRKAEEFSKRRVKSRTLKAKTN